MTAPVLAVTVGDPVGIGPEITAQVLDRIRRSR
jgi:4-hydroxy-L-threonine phosphate dehydrogenase PdxA